MTQSEPLQLKQVLETQLLKKPSKELQKELMQLIQLVPEQAKEITVDLASTILSRGYNKEVFDQFWRFLQAILENQSQKIIDAERQNTQALIIRHLRSTTHQK